MFPSTLSCYTCQSSSMQALYALAYLSKVRNSSSVVAIHVLKLYTTHYPSYGNGLSGCKLLACKTHPESREDILCLAYGFIRVNVCLEMVTMLIKWIFFRKTTLYSAGRGWVSPTLLFDHNTDAVSDCWEGITCSFLCDNGFHFKIPQVTNAI